ncbi:exosome non-catalytic core subunit rrp46 [Coniothyrium glycines]
MAAPHATLTHLHRADGSATYAHNGYALIGAVNGPIEVLRRDERPDEATIEVNVRPPAGVGSPRERHLETLVHNTLHGIVLARLIPRTLVQVTLQVRSLPEQDESTGLDTSLTLLPHLLHTAVLALLSASIPLSTVLTSTLIAIPSQGPLLVSPTADQLLRAKPIRSVHVFAFSASNKLLLNESHGDFSYDEWAEACQVAEQVCFGDSEEDDEGGVRLDGMDLDLAAQGQAQSDNLDKWLRSVVQRKVEHEQRWKSAT